jgi:uncharacterized protein
MNRIVVFFYTFFQARKALFYSVLISLFIVFAFFASKISFQEDITKMIPDDESTKGYKSAIKNLRIIDKIVVSFNADSLGMEDSLISAANRFVDQITSDTNSNNLITDIRYRIDEERLSAIYDLTYNNLPIYLSDKDYRRIDSLTTESGVKESIQRSYHKLISPASVVLKQFVLKDPLSLTTPALEKLQAMQAEDSYELHDGYIFKKDKKTLVVFITPLHASNNTKLNAPLIDVIESNINKVKNGAIDVAYFGATAVAVANARQIEQDIKMIASISMLVVLVFLYFFYRSWSLPFLMISPIVFGGLFALSLIYFIQGAMSAIAIGAGSVVIGIALDYSFHVFAHYQHTREIKTVVRDVAIPMMIGSISTVGAFFSLLYVHSDILSDFGLFAGLCLIGASLFSLFFLPHLIETFAVKKESIQQKDETKIASFIFKMVSLKPEKSKWLVGLIFVLTIVFIYFSNRVSFDSDLSQINYMPKELKDAENALYQSDTAKGKVVFFVFKGKDVSEAMYQNERALKLIESLKQYNQINRYAGVSGLLPSDSIQLQRINHWNAYWTPEKIEQVKRYIEKYSIELGFKAEAFTPFFELLDKKYTIMQDADRAFLTDVFLKEYLQIDSSGVTLLASMRVSPTMSDNVYDAFDSIKNLTILDRQLFYSKFLLIVKDDFNQILFSSSILVFLILLISYGRLELSLISFLPMVVSWFWILGIMGIFDIHFNIVNIIISTFVFGLGDDYAIFITDGLQKKYSEGRDNLPSYKVSIFLSAFTTIIAMGALIFAKHPALKSIAIISIIGIVCVFLISYILIPMLFKWFVTDRTDNGKQPLTLVIVCRTFIYQMLTIFLIVFAFVVKVCLLLCCLIISKRQCRRFYKYVIYRTARFLYDITFFLDKKHVKTPIGLGEQAHVLCVNNQSILSLLFVLTIHKRVVMFFNADYAPSLFERLILFIHDLSFNATNLTVSISDCIKDGYIPVLLCEEAIIEGEHKIELDSVVFQELHLLGVGVLVCVLVGAETSIAKKDSVIYRGFLVVEFSNFIQHSNQIETFKNLNNAYHNIYTSIYQRLPTRAYFNKIMSSYIYKGPVLEWYFRIKVQLEKSYQEFNDLLPSKGKIYDLGCGYGFLDYFLMLHSNDRTIIGVDYDLDKIIVAQNSYLKMDQLVFTNIDVMNVTVEHADAVLMLDVLHYLSAENQYALIRSSFEGLNKGGVLIIRDGDASQVLKHKRTKLTEFFSTKLLMFNKQTERELCFITSDMIIKILNDFNVEVHVLDTTVYTSNIIHYVVKK